VWFRELRVGLFGFIHELKVGIYKVAENTCNS